MCKYDTQQFFPLSVYSCAKDAIWSTLNLLCFDYAIKQLPPPLLLFLFKICLVIVTFLFQMKFRISLSNSTGKSLQGGSNTAQDRITDKRLGLPAFHISTYMKQVSMNIRGWRTVSDLWNIENKPSLTTAPVYCLEHFQALGQVGGTEAEPQRLPDW